ncbi:MAG TPA: NUDIX domain-containing protein [Caldilineaceae bacterium]|nr:NUDIX domain-containing protein [Caldilineaceae bacterium]
MNNGNFLRTQVRLLVEGIAPLDQIEAEHIATTLAWINSGAALFRTQKPATPPQHLVSYFVVVDWANRQLLLTDHKDAGLWLPSGGHVEPEEHPRDTVMREAQEELGLAARFVWPDPIFLTVTETQGLSAGHTDVSLWYVLHGNLSMNFIHDPGEFRGVAWFGFDELPSVRVEPHLARFLAKLQKMYSPSHPLTGHSLQI